MMELQSGFFKMVSTDMIRKLPIYIKFNTTTSPIFERKSAMFTSSLFLIRYLLNPTR